MKNVVKMFIFVLLTIANVNLVSAMEEAGEVTRLSVAVTRDISNIARDQHIKEMYDFARSLTDLVGRRAKTAAMFGEFTRTYRVPGARRVKTGTADVGAEERKA